MKKASEQEESVADEWRASAWSILTFGWVQVYTCHDRLMSASLSNSVRWFAVSPYTLSVILDSLSTAFTPPPFIQLVFSKLYLRNESLYFTMQYILH